MLAHLNNVQYYRCFEFTIIEYLTHSSGAFIHRRIIPLVVENRCNFLAPIALCESLDAGLRVVHIGQSSVRYELGLFEQQNDAPSACGRFVHAYFDRQENKTAPVPDEVRVALDAIASERSFDSS